MESTDLGVGDRRTTPGPGGPPNLAAVQRGLQFAVPVRPDEPMQREGGTRACHAGPQRRILGGRAGGRGGGGPVPPRLGDLAQAPRLQSAPRRSCAHRSPRAPGGSGGGGGAGGWEGGPGGRGGAGAGRGVGLGARLASQPSKPRRSWRAPGTGEGRRQAAMPTTGARAEAGPRVSAPGLGREGSAEGVPGGGARVQLARALQGAIQARRRPVLAGPEGEEARPGVRRPGERTCARACAPARSAGRGPAAIGSPALPRQLPHLTRHPDLPTPGPAGTRTCLTVRVGCELLAYHNPITSEMPLTSFA